MKIAGRQKNWRGDFKGRYFMSFKIRSESQNNCIKLELEMFQVIT